MPSFHSVNIDGNKIFYREAGPKTAANILLLHGFPTSSHMFRNLIPLLADRYHVIAPDLPGFGFSDVPDGRTFRYTFENLAKTIDRFTEAMGLDRYAIYVFDYGAPVGLRLALAHPERVTAIISQNGNAYEEGLSQGWSPIQKYWKEPTPANRDALRDFLTPEATRSQYVYGVRDENQVAPKPIRLIRPCWRDQAITRSSSTFSWTMRATSHFTRSSRIISERESHRCSPFGDRTIRFSWLPAPKLSNATIRTPRSISLTLDTSQSRPTIARSPMSSASSLAGRSPDKLVPPNEQLRPDF
jgi:pimeloyl-ACP methyl ester carboxylesterase